MDEYGQTNTEAGINIRLANTDDVVVAEVDVWVDGNNGYEYYTSKASSRRDPSDTPNTDIGLKLALGRAIRQLGREILKDGQALVREAENKRQSQLEAAEASRIRKAERGQAKRSIVDYGVCICGDPKCDLMW